MRGHQSIRARSATESSRGRPAKRTGSKPTKIIGLPTDPFSSHTLATKCFLFFHLNSDHSTHFHTRKARWYNPFVGRFVGRDPERYSSFNLGNDICHMDDPEFVLSEHHTGLYLFNSNIPTILVDPSGRRSCISGVEIEHTITASFINQYSFIFGRFKAENICVGTPRSCSYFTFVDQYGLFFGVTPVSFATRQFSCCKECDCANINDLDGFAWGADLTCTLPVGGVVLGGYKTNGYDCRYRKFSMGWPSCGMGGGFSITAFFNCK